MDYLFDSLMEYCHSDAYPFHMPGHKRNMSMLREIYGKTDWNPFEIDITEIDGFDNLHHAQGILKEAQERMAQLYGANISFFLINGSTCGILASVFACTSQKGTILCARNCHKAVYHAAELRELKTEYLYPVWKKENGINGVIEPEDVETALCRYPEIEAVLLTSPTYDGIVSDIRAIAQIVHAHGKYLIVDEAHGAHLGFHSYFPENSLNSGADLVIHSLHKTLPSMTQTAVLHVSRDSAADVEKVKKYLGIFETSSPSYVFMAGMDQCARYLQNNHESLFEEFAQRLERFYQKSEELKKIHVLNLRGKDPSKIVVFAPGKTGGELADMLRKKYHLEVEMAARDYVIALTSVCDTDEGFHRLYEALKEIDDHISLNPGIDERDGGEDGRKNDPDVYCRISQAADSEQEEVLLTESEGKISAEYAYLYPPGIPLLVPGEVISGEMILEMTEDMEEGFELQGLQDHSGKTIRVIKENCDEK